MGETSTAGGYSPASGRFHHEPSARRALDRDIRSLDLEPITYLVAMEQDWPLEKLDAIEFEYRCFLQLIRDHPGENIVPSRDCDTYWHAHILTLELYLEHCQRLFGHPLLHYPFSGALGEEDLARQQQRFRRCQELHINLMNRVRGTRHRGTTGDDHDTAIHQVPQSRRHADAAQGA